MTLSDYISNFQGTVTIDGVTCTTLPTTLDGKKGVTLLFSRKSKPVEVATTDNHQIEVDGVEQYRITVRPYMTKQGSPEFDFMTKWNHDVPMPLRTMVGTIVKETKGMVYMSLHGDTDGKPVQCCLKCGRRITNPVSQYFGLGPECGGHNYTNPFATQEELLSAVDAYRRDYLQKITWEGWIIKSAIIEQEKI